MPDRHWLLTDAAAGLRVDQFAVSAGAASVRQLRLRGGLSDGVDVIEVNNGALSFTVLPTRGLGLWRAAYRGLPLKWDSPVQGPVHPQFVNLEARGGLGWLEGFDELLCRCGLASNGPPGKDGNAVLTLHGRIANRPAQRVEVTVADSGAVRVSGQVEE